MGRFSSLMRPEARRGSGIRSRLLPSVTAQRADGPTVGLIVPHGLASLEGCPASGSSFASCWFGLIVGLSFIEAPLKFAAPGITIPLGLGIGRLVFTALAIAGWILLLALTAVALPRPRIDRAAWANIGALWVVLAVQSFLVRPALSARSDVIIAGGDPGESWLHYGYVAADLVIVALLAVWVVRASRSIVPPEAPQTVGD